jgi:hypothetical protein
LFGSSARGEPWQHSDIDIGILPRDDLPSSVFARLAGDIEESMIPYDVDLVDFAPRPTGTGQRCALQRREVAGLAIPIAETEAAALATLDEALRKHPSPRTRMRERRAPRPATAGRGKGPPIPGSSQIKSGRRMRGDRGE